MAVVPGGIETENQPPMTVPLRHFLVGIAMLLAGSTLGVAVGLGVAPAWAGVAHVHLLLAGWVCVTIMGAMTQFVPVWSGVSLHSRRLAVVQLWLVAVGLTGLAAAFLLGALDWLAPFGAVAVAGFWTFVYNLGRTLARVEEYDVTERHFAVALGFFLAVTALGLVLAVDLAVPLLPVAVPLLPVPPISRTGVVGAHVALAVFGAVLTTVFGALYQLATMFTQTELRGIDLRIERFETVAYPAGVVGLATGRLLSVPELATVGGLAVVAGVAGMGVVLARRLHGSRVEPTPMLRRYAVAAPAMVLWALATLPAWVRAPLDPAVRFGAPGTVHLVAVGAVGFVVLGTLYHVVPFVVWVHRYSDRLGFEDVPMIDDLYDDRIARADLVATAAGTALLVGVDLLGLPTEVSVAGGVLTTLGVGLFAANLALVLGRHSPHSLAGTLFDSVGASDHGEAEGEGGDADEPTPGSGD